MSSNIAAYAQCLQYRRPRPGNPTGVRKEIAEHGLAHWCYSVLLPNIRGQFNRVMLANPLGTVLDDENPTARMRWHPKLLHGCAGVQDPMRDLVGAIGLIREAGIEVDLYVGEQHADGMTFAEFMAMAAPLIRAGVRRFGVDSSCNEPEQGDLRYWAMLTSEVPEGDRIEVLAEAAILPGTVGDVRDWGHTFTYGYWGRRERPDWGADRNIVLDRRERGKSWIIAQAGGLEETRAAVKEITEAGHNVYVPFWAGEAAREHSVTRKSRQNGQK